MTEETRIDNVTPFGWLGDEEIIRQVYTDPKATEREMSLAIRLAELLDANEILEEELEGLLGADEERH